MTDAVRRPTQSPPVCRCCHAGGALAAAFLLATCASEPTAVERTPQPSVTSTTVLPNANNVLSATVVVRVQHADSVAVTFHPATMPSADAVTPTTVVTKDSAAIPLLGLLPEQRYDVRAVAYGGRTSATGDVTEFTTSALPSSLPRYVASGPDPSPGYVVFASGKYGIVIDNTGRVVWYREFPDGVGLSFMAEPTGHYVARPATPDPSDIEPWVEFDALGAMVRTLTCAGGLTPRLHDLILEADGSYWILCDETRTMDLTASGGVAAARVTGTVVQHVAAGGNLLFQWSPFDHFDITDAPLADRSGAAVNWTHGNALDHDTDGNIVVSFRTLGEITKIDAKTGAVIYRLGGKQNQFTFSGTPMPAFSRQHGLRVDGPGSLVLLDNTGDPTESRAEHYLMDEGARTARLVSAQGAGPGIVTEIGGSVQPNAGGRTLVSFGTAGRVEEFDAAGRVVWHIESNPGYVFRAQRIKSLYAPGVGTAR